MKEKHFSAFYGGKEFQENIFSLAFLKALSAISNNEEDGGETNGFDDQELELKAMGRNRRLGIVMTRNSSWKLMSLAECLWTLFI